MLKIHNYELVRIRIGSQDKEYCDVSKVVPFLVGLE